MNPGSFWCQEARLGWGYDRMATNKLQHWKFNQQKNLIDSSSEMGIPEYSDNHGFFLPNHSEEFGKQKWRCSNVDHTKMELDNWNLDWTSQSLASVAYANWRIKNGEFGKNGYLVSNHGGAWGYVANSGPIHKPKLQTHAIGSWCSSHEHDFIPSLGPRPSPFIFSELRVGK